MEKALDERSESRLFRIVTIKDSGSAEGGDQHPPRYNKGVSQKLGTPYLFIITNVSNILWHASKHLHSLDYVLYLHRGILKKGYTNT